MGAKRTKDTHVQIGCLIDKKLWKELKLLALHIDKTASILLEEAIEDILKKYKRP